MHDVPRRAVMGLGSNLGDRVRTVLAAADMLVRLPAVRGGLVSPLYETDPVGGLPQRDYVNGAVLLQTTLPSRALLHIALEIERGFGRVRRERNGPRTLDIDVLWIEGEVVNEPTLTVPHPRLRERAFALVPLLDVVPDAVDPRTGCAYAVALAQLALRGVRPLVGWVGDDAASVHGSASGG
ncbi:MAG: 2-amino-4-hydroxy-6-hydroxymethyldihydropteridine diphosphokinase [Polyangiaceae bacterium]|jgi:2-amino-4-hydroxy-6-hydroxymethyldihydropteridine diphosphokinase|nr:2-amino-4-hydroxy-6-hydroxymethyldihydropteridine diphosphokinase [Polyangiaceae bacterium]